MMFRGTEYVGTLVSSSVLRCGPALLHAANYACGNWYVYAEISSLHRGLYGPTYTIVCPD